MEIPVRWGMGFALESPVFGNEYGHRVAYWGGNGGSLGFVDFDERMAVGFVMNRWIEGPYEQLRNNGSSGLPTIRWEQRNQSVLRVKKCKFKPSDREAPSVNES